MRENWLDIKGYEGIYQVSDFGRVKRLAHVTHFDREPGSKTQMSYTYDEMIIKQHENSAGYYRVTLWENGVYQRFLTHRLVAQHFIPNVKGVSTVNHVDGNKKNNLSSNLEWMTRSENAKHAIEAGLYVPNTKGINPPRQVVQLDKDTGEVIKEYSTMTEAYKETGISHISSVCRGVRKTAGGYVWKYKEVVKI